MPLHDDFSVGRSTRMIVRIYTGQDGQTHFEDLPLPAEESHNIALQAGANLVFRCFPADYWSDWHTAPRRQYIFILAGQMEIGIGDGTTRRFGPRSKASSLSSSSGLSPPPMLTPTLLCRISMRPQRARAASIAAASVSSLVTSAAKGTHSPPCVAIAAVSSAEAISRSTARILAPSCAKRSVVARPFPIPSPGLCPAPTITATLPSRRLAALLATGVQGCLYGASLRKSARASRI